MAHDLKNFKTNLRKSESEALKKLKENTNIIIKVADKGSAILIMNIEFYDRKINEMLQNTNMYEETNSKKDIIRING